MKPLSPLTFFISLISFTLLLLLALSCGRPSSQAQPESFTRHATGFTVATSGVATVVELANPWNVGRVLNRYVLVPRDVPLPEGLPEGTLIRTPVRRLAVYASVHVAMIERLGAVESIEGVCEPMYISSAAIRQRITEGLTVDLGMSVSPDIEKMMDRGIEYIIASPFQNAGYGAASKTGIPIIEGADYMEPTPLGRAEWIRFFGLLLDCRERADSVFADTERNYLRLKGLAAQTVARPEVLMEKRYGASWYVPAEGSYMSVMLADAGASNPFDYISSAGSVPLAFETVLDRAIHAPLWLIKYNAATELTYSLLRDEYAPYEAFDAFKNRGIYACHTGLRPYHEETPLQPDLLLRDFIMMSHPELLAGDSLRYFVRIGD